MLLTTSFPVGHGSHGNQADFVNVGIFSSQLLLIPVPGFGVESAFVGVGLRRWFRLGSWMLRETTGEVWKGEEHTVSCGRCTGRKT